MMQPAHSIEPLAPDLRSFAVDWFLLIGRICFASDFLLFGSRKLNNLSIIYNLIEAHHLPGALVYPTIVLQLGCGLAVLIGFQTRLAAALLAWFCIVAPSIFWLNNLENLTRDYAAAGGLLLLLLFGPGAIAIDARLRRSSDLVMKFFPATLTRQAIIDRVMLAARMLIALPFLADVVKKVIHLGSERALFEASGIPGDAVYLVMLLELIAGLMVLLGVRVRVAAVVLLAWAVVLGIVIHNPRYDFNIFGGNFAAVMMKNYLNRGAATFFKDVTTVGALLMLFVYGAGGLSITRREGIAEAPLPIRR